MGNLIKVTTIPKIVNDGKLQAYYDSQVMNLFSIYVEMWVFTRYKEDSAKTNTLKSWAIRTH